MQLRLKVESFEIFRSGRGTKRSITRRWYYVLAIYLDTLAVLSENLDGTCGVFTRHITKIHAKSDAFA